MNEDVRRRIVHRVEFQVLAVLFGFLSSLDGLNISYDSSKSGGDEGLTPKQKKQHK